MSETKQLCASIHTVMIYDRGGKNRLTVLRDVSHVEYSREKTKTSYAKVVLSKSSCEDQLEDLNKISSSRHEVVIYRGSDRVWEGPIGRVKWRANGMVIEAKDCFQYLHGTALSKIWATPEASSTPMTTRVQQIVNHELTVPYVMQLNGGVSVTVPRWEGITPPANILPYLEVRPSATLLTRSTTEAFEMTLGEHLWALAQGGLSWTTVGRKIIIWDSAVDLGKTRVVTEKDFYGAIDVVEDGSEVQAVVHTSAKRDEGDPDDPDDDTGGVGNAGGPHDFYGVWTGIHSLSNEEGTEGPTQTELNSQAVRLRRGKTPVPLRIEVPNGAGLRLSHDLQINDLVAGGVMPVRATMNLKPIAQDQRIVRMKVLETGDGESILVELESAGEAFLV